MPSFNIEVEFEAFCRKCGKGICGNVYERKYRNRGIDQIEIEPCDCVLDEIEDLNKTVSELDQKIFELEAQLDA